MAGVAAFFGHSKKYECQKSGPEDFRGYIKIVDHRTRLLGACSDGIGTCDGFADGNDIFAYAGSGGRHRFARFKGLSLSRSMKQWPVTCGQWSVKSL